MVGKGITCIVNDSPVHLRLGAPASVVAGWFGCDGSAVAALQISRSRAGSPVRVLV